MNHRSKGEDALLLVLIVGILAMDTELVRQLCRWEDSLADAFMSRNGAMAVFSFVWCVGQLVIMADYYARARSKRAASGSAEGAAEPGRLARYVGIGVSVLMAVGAFVMTAMMEAPFPLKVLLTACAVIAVLVLLMRVFGKKRRS